MFDLIDKETQNFKNSRIGYLSISDVSYDNDLNQKKLFYNKKYYAFSKGKGGKDYKYFLLADTFQKLFYLIKIDINNQLKKRIDIKNVDGEFSLWKCKILLNKTKREEYKLPSGFKDNKNKLAEYDNLEYCFNVINDDKFFTEQNDLKLIKQSIFIEELKEYFEKGKKHE